MFEKKLIAILSALLLPYCATTGTPSREQTPAERANATASSTAVAVPSDKPPLRMPLLAIEVEITADGVKPISAKIVQAPPIANSAFADLRVQVGGVDGWAYTMRDPRLVEVNDPNERRTIVLESARAFVFVPLLAAATALSVEPVAGVDMDRDVSRGGTFDVRALAEEVCSRTQSELPVCREILAR